MRGEARGAQLGEHLRRVLERVLEVVRVLHPPEIADRGGYKLYWPWARTERGRLGLRGGGGEGAYEGAVHVEGVLLDAGDALGEPALLVVAAAVGQHPGGRRLGGLRPRPPRRRLGAGRSRSGRSRRAWLCPPRVWLGAGVCVLRVFFYVQFLAISFW